MKKAILILIVILFCVASASAETVYLKNGKTVRGKIIEKTDKYIKIDIAGVAVPYFNDEVDRIEETNAQPAAEARPVTTNVAEGELYVDEQFGFEIRGPKGWSKEIKPPIPGKTTLPTVTYAKYAQGKGETAMPKLGITIDILGRTIDVSKKDVSSAVDFSRFIVQQWKDKLAYYKSGALMVIEPPHEIEINGIKGSRAIFDLTDKSGKGLRQVDYKFMNGDVVISIMGVGWPVAFDADLKNFEATANSFRFISSSPGKSAQPPQMTDYQTKLHKALAELMDKQKTNPPSKSASGEELFDVTKFNASNLNFTPVDPGSWETIKAKTLSRMDKADSFMAYYIQKNKDDRDLADKGYKNISWMMTFISPRDFEITQTMYKQGVLDIWRVVGDDMFNNFGIWVPATEPGSGSNPKIEQIIKMRKTIYRMLHFQNSLELLKQQMPVEVARDLRNGYTIAKFKVSDPAKFLFFEDLFGSLNTEATVWISDKDKTIMCVKTVVIGNHTSGRPVNMEFEHYFKDYDVALKVGRPDMSWLEEKS